MNPTRLQLLIIVSASQLFSLCQHASALTNDLPSNLISYSSIPKFITPSDPESENTLSCELTFWPYSLSFPLPHIVLFGKVVGARSRSVDKTASPTSPNHDRQNNYTLAERDHEHRKGNTPIKSLLGNAMGLGILDDSSYDDGDGLFTGGWATYFTQNQIPGLWYFSSAVKWSINKLKLVPLSMSV